VLPPYSILIVDEAHHSKRSRPTTSAAASRARRSSASCARRRARPRAAAVGATRDALGVVLARCRGAAIELFEAVAHFVGTRIVAAIGPLRAAAGLAAAPVERGARPARGAALHGHDEGAQAELAARAAAAGTFAQSIGEIIRGSQSETSSAAPRSSGDAASEFVIFAERIGPQSRRARRRPRRLRALQRADRSGDRSSRASCLLRCTGRC